MRPTDKLASGEEPSGDVPSRDEEEGRDLEEGVSDLQQQQKEAEMRRQRL